MRQVRWNKLARLDYFKNIDYLLSEWSDKDAQDFIDDVYETEFILKQGIVDFQDTDMEGVKRLVLCKQITLFYRIINDKTVEFLRFWNNHQDFEKFTLK